LNNITKIALKLTGLNSVPPAREYNALSQTFFKLDKVNLIYYVKKLEK